MAMRFASIITEYSHTMISKLTALVGGTSAISMTPAGALIAQEMPLLGRIGNWLIHWPWIETLSHIAVILLIIERGFILWAWNNKRRRGEL